MRSVWTSVHNDVQVSHAIWDTKGQKDSWYSAG